MRLCIKIPLLCLLLLTAGYFGYRVYESEQSNVRSSMLLNDVKTNADDVSAFLRRENPSPFIHSFSPAPNESNTVNADAPLYSYAAPEGFIITSFSSKWPVAKLEALYDELMRNKHGKELETLQEVRIYPQKDEHALATHESSSSAFIFEYPAFNGKVKIDFWLQNGLITLYGGDTNITVESMAASLSHEYGHHYTFYHMFKDKERGSEYDQLRNIDADHLIYWSDIRSMDYYYQNHRWVLVEIAANDYVQLMGSPNAKKSMVFYDVYDLLHTNKKNISDAMLIMDAYNIHPQDNPLIPTAYEVKGLKEFFYRFIDDPMPPAPAFPLDITISIKRESVNHQLESGNRTFVHYRLTWDTPYKVDHVQYTLVYYEEDDYYAFPIKTTQAGQSAQAYIGAVTKDYGDHINYMDDNLSRGTKTFIVTALFTDGTIYTSLPLTVDFDGGQP